MYDEAVKVSSRAKGLLDQISYERADNDDLKGDYFIGVKGQQESVFEVTAVPAGDAGDHRAWTMLAEGQERAGAMHKDTASDKYRFTVDMPEGFEREILIDIYARNQN